MLRSGCQTIHVQSVFRLSDNHLSHREPVIQPRSEWIRYFWRSRRSWFCQQLPIPGLSFRTKLMLLMKWTCGSERATRPQSYAMCPSLWSQLVMAPPRGTWRNSSSIQQVSAAFAYACQYFNIIEAQLFSCSSNATNTAIFETWHWVMYNSHWSFQLWMIFIDDLILYYRSYSAISIIHWIFGIDNEAMTTNYHQDHVSFTVKNLPLRATGPAFCDTPIVKGRKHVLTNLYVVPHRPLPVIDQRRALRVPMGNTTYLQCKSVGAEPAPVLRWVDGEGNSLFPLATRAWENTTSFPACLWPWHQNWSAPTTAALLISPSTQICRFKNRPIPFTSLTRMRRARRWLDSNAPLF